MSSAIKELKRLTVKCNDFSEAFEFFLTNFAENETMKSLEKPVKKSQFYVELLNPLVKRFLQNVTITGCYLMRIKRFHLTHGVVMLSTGEGLSLYMLDDEKVGMLVRSSLSGKTDYYRFTMNIFKEPPILPDTISTTVN